MSCASLPAGTPGGWLGSPGASWGLPFAAPKTRTRQGFAFEADQSVYPPSSHLLATSFIFTPPGFVHDPLFLPPVFAPIASVTSPLVTCQRWTVLKVYAIATGHTHPNPSETGRRMLCGLRESSRDLEHTLSRRREADHLLRLSTPALSLTTTAIFRTRIHEFGSKVHSFHFSECLWILQPLFSIEA